MSEMRKRVARVIADNEKYCAETKRVPCVTPSTDCDCWRTAGAVIEAMREPQGRFRNILDSYGLQNGGSLLEIWDEVIDAALEDETTKK